MTDRTRATHYAYWNTPDNSGVTRRWRKWAEEVCVEPTLDVLAALPCLVGDGAVSCVDGSCVTCEARKRVPAPGGSQNEAGT